jgi:TatD DNase family protein
MLIDSHCHLDTFVKRGTLQAVLNNAVKAGVNRMITVGTSSEDWETYHSLAKLYTGQIDYTVGLHPCHVDENWEQELEKLAQLLHLGDTVRPVALGEIGLDYFHLPKDESSRDRAVALQKQAFVAQIELARSADLPVIIHSRNAFDDCVKMIDSSRSVWDRIVFHCFSEGRDEIDRINLRGGRGSFTGIITYPNTNVRPVRDALLEQGVERLMIETDCPYLTPVPHKGEENQPAFLRYTFQAAASILEIPVIELEEQLAANTREFFNLVS